MPKRLRDFMEIAPSSWNLAVKSRDGVHVACCIPYSSQAVFKLRYNSSHQILQDSITMVVENGIAAASFYCVLTSCILLLLFCHGILPRINGTNSIISSTSTSSSSVSSNGSSEAAEKAILEEKTGKRQAQRQELHEEEEDQCAGKRIFVYNLPKRFNQELLQRCDFGMVKWLSFCGHASNDGLGLPLSPDAHQDSSRTSVGKGWFRTDSYMLEVIFHARMQKYSCLTNNSATADAFFVPYYAGIDALHYLYNRDVDKRLHGADLVKWLEQHAAQEWARSGGRNHFMVLGRTSWDFAMPGDKLARWGTPILHSPMIANMTTLFIERNPWKPNEHAVPYPTSFHPSSMQELQDWISRAGNAERRHLFAFAGATRPTQSRSIRTILLEQCLGSKRCDLVDCGKLKCAHNPAPIISSFLSSQFCLQPRGDTPTRRSAFDAMISGCIPVFFHSDSAYTQYKWHLPEDLESFSVFISEEDIRGGLRVEHALKKYSPERVRKMRDAVLGTIPRLIYANHEIGIRDAFDVSIEGVLDTVSKLRKRI